jgi:hypothetical protein
MPPLKSEVPQQAAEARDNPAAEYSEENKVVVSYQFSVFSIKLGADLRKGFGIEIVDSRNYRAGAK